MSELTRTFAREHPHLVARVSEILADELQHNPSQTLLSSLKDLNAETAVETSKRSSLRAS